MNHRTVWNTVQSICIASLYLCALVPVATSLAADATSESEARWWPVQAVPNALVRLEQNDFPSPRVSYEMMAQSVAGLAAKAVNEGRGDELVWVGDGNEWLARRLVRHPD